MTRGHGGKKPQRHRDTEKIEREDRQGRKVSARPAREAGLETKRAVKTQSLLYRALCVFAALFVSSEAGSAGHRSRSADFSVSLCLCDQMKGPSLTPAG
jgi:hypothetical protein